MRPKDFKNPYKDKLNWTAGIELQAYEAGADAMLEGLKKDGILLDIHDCHNFINRTNKKGYLVFIEE